MSDAISKIIPRNEKSLVSKTAIESATDYLKSRVKADEIKAVFYDKPAFIDCGENLKKILCPACGAIISFRWWGEQMDVAYKGDFNELGVKLPCCGNNSSLNDLKYQFVCGFSRWMIEIRDIEVAVTDEIKEELERILGEEIKLVEARY